MAAYAFSRESMVRGYHEYKSLWGITLLKLLLGCGNSSSRFTGALLKFFKIDILAVNSNSNASFMPVRVFNWLKFGWDKFGELIIIRQIRQRFPRQSFPPYSNLAT